MNTENATTLEPSQAVQLEKLAETIRASYDSAESLSKKAKESAHQAVREALICGKALNDAKSLMTHGRWLKWLEKNCPDISEKTAQRYMRVAKASHVTDLSDFQSLRQLYIACEILPQPEPTERAPRQLSIGWFDSTLSAFKNNIAKVEPIITADETSRQTFAQVCAELHKITGELCDRYGIAH